MSLRQSRTLEILDGSTVCMRCKFVLSKAGQPWKKNASLSVVKVKDIPGSTASTHHEVILRHFSCPSCSVVLDTETALPADPFLDDILFF